MPDQTVTVVAEHEFWATLKAKGLSEPDCSPAQVILRPTELEIKKILEESSNMSSVHLVNGWTGVTQNRLILPRLSKTKALIGLLSEGADSQGIQGLARRAKYCIDRYTTGRNIDFTLAMGQLGVRWFQSVGYAPSRLFPFAYVTESPIVASESRIEKNADILRILYLGQIIERKDGVTAIRALSGLPASNWQFEVYGNGADLPRWKLEADESGVAERIRFYPAVANNEIGNLFESADILLLPSKWDGWGAVVNEALMCGVPVVCSDRCGAADLLREPWRGSIFKAGSVDSLRGALHTWIERSIIEESKLRIRKWSSAIEGPQAALYLVEIVNFIRNGGQRPSPPWY
jgi:glycosyltransferase involved in cell wall biosynthesis